MTLLSIALGGVLFGGLDPQHVPEVIYLRLAAVSSF
jgi:hypothetical protein